MNLGDSDSEEDVFITKPSHTLPFTALLNVPLSKKRGRSKKEEGQDKDLLEKDVKKVVKKRKTVSKPPSTDTSANATAVVAIDLTGQDASTDGVTIALPRPTVTAHPKRELRQTTGNKCLECKGVTTTLWRKVDNGVLCDICFSLKDPKKEKVLGNVNAPASESESMDRLPGAMKGKKSGAPSHTSTAHVECAAKTETASKVVEPDRETPPDEDNFSHFISQYTPPSGVIFDYKSNPSTQLSTLWEKTNCSLNSQLDISNGMEHHLPPANFDFGLYGNVEKEEGSGGGTTTATAPITTETAVAASGRTSSSKLQEGGGGEGTIANRPKRQTTKCYSCKLVNSTLWRPVMTDNGSQVFCDVCFDDASKAALVFQSKVEVDGTGGSNDRKKQAGAGKTTPVKVVSSKPASLPVPNTGSATKMSLSSLLKAPLSEREKLKDMYRGGEERMRQILREHHPNDTPDDPTWDTVTEGRSQTHHSESAVADFVDGRRGLVPSDTLTRTMEIDNESEVGRGKGCHQVAGIDDMAMELEGDVDTFIHEHDDPSALPSSVLHADNSKPAENSTSQFECHEDMTTSSSHLSKKAVDKEGRCAEDRIVFAPTFDVIDVESEIDPPPLPNTVGGGRFAVVPEARVDCMICNQNITQLTDSERNIHVGLCLDENSLPPPEAAPPSMSRSSATSSSSSRSNPGSNLPPPTSIGAPSTESLMQFAFNGRAEKNTAAKQQGSSPVPREMAAVPDGTPSITAAAITTDKPPGVAKPKKSGGKKAAPLTEYCHICKLPFDTTSKKERTAHVIICKQTHALSLTAVEGTQENVDDFILPNANKSKSCVLSKAPEGAKPVPVNKKKAQSVVQTLKNKLKELDQQASRLADERKVVIRQLREAVEAEAKAVDERIANAVVPTIDESLAIMFGRDKVEYIGGANHEQRVDVVSSTPAFAPSRINTVMLSSAAAHLSAAPSTHAGRSLWSASIGVDCQGLDLSQSEFFTNLFTDVFPAFDKKKLQRTVTHESRDVFHLIVPTSVSNCFLLDRVPPADAVPPCVVKFFPEWEEQIAFLLDRGNEELTEGLRGLQEQRALFEESAADEDRERGEACMYFEKYITEIMNRNDEIARKEGTTSPLIPNDAVIGSSLERMDDDLGMCLSPLHDDDEKDIALSPLNSDCVSINDLISDDDDSVAPPTYSLNLPTISGMDMGVDVGVGALLHYSPAGKSSSVVDDGVDDAFHDLRTMRPTVAATPSCNDRIFSSQPAPARYNPPSLDPTADIGASSVIAPPGPGLSYSEQVAMVQSFHFTQPAPTTLKGKGGKRSKTASLDNSVSISKNASLDNSVCDDEPDFSLDSKLANFIVNSKMYEKILLLETINMATLLKDMQAGGIKVSKAKLMNYLDRNGVMYRLPTAARKKKGP
jgi:hypothetical protein